LTDAVAACAANSAAWHAAWLSALRLRSTSEPRAWHAIDVPPSIYCAAITTDAAATADDVAASCGAVCDSWSALDLGAAGFGPLWTMPWYRREPAPLPGDEPPSDLEIAHVATPHDVEEFELVSIRGFRDESASVEPGAIHPAGILEEPRMTMLTGRAGGRPVAAAMAYDDGYTVGIYGVATVASARGRGYGSALTRALVDPARPAVLSSSAVAERLYRRLGFVRVGELRLWAPEANSTGSASS
jgi:GNAT superfamily N-acetyltransferase